MDRISRIRRALADLIDDRPGRDTVLMEIPRDVQPQIRAMIWRQRVENASARWEAAVSEVSPQQWRDAVKLLMDRERARQAGE